MAKTLVVQAKVRKEFGKNHNRRLRAQGMIPGTVYGHKMEAVSVTVDPKEIHRILHSDSGRNTIFKLKVEGSSHDVLIRDFQLDPLRDTLLHADFQAIAMDQAMTFEVPVEPVGVSKGVKTSGGILDVVLRTIEIECLPADVPDQIEIDVTDLDIGDSVRVSQLKVDTSKLKILNDSNLVVINVSMPAIEKVEEAPVAEVAEGEEAAAEPEVIKKGKAEEEAAEE